MFDKLQSVLATVAPALGTVAIVCGGVAGALALLDWSLSQAVRDRIKDISMRTWYWLSYQRTWPYVQALQRQRTFDVFYGVAALFITTFFVGFMVVQFVKDRGALSFWMWLVPLAFIAAPLVVYAIGRISLRKLFGIITRPNAAWKMLLRGWAAYVLILLAMVAAMAPLILLWNRYIEFVKAWSIITVPVLLVFWTAFYLTFFVLYSILFLTFYILAVYCLILIFKIFEFVALKLAEYDKGPILAAAAALTAIGSVLKAFGSS